MENLQTHLDTFNFCTQAVEVNRFFDPDKTKTKTTFWGGRLIEVDGYSGSVDLNELAGKFCQDGGTPTPEVDRQPLDRKKLDFYQARVELAQKLGGFYVMTDEQIKSNFLTRLISWVRSFFESRLVQRVRNGEFRGITEKDLNRWEEGLASQQKGYFNFWPFVRA